MNFYQTDKYGGVLAQLITASHTTCRGLVVCWLNIILVKLFNRGQWNKAELPHIFIPKDRC